MTREPKDLICSLYHQIIGRFNDFYNYEGTISEFIRDPYFGAENILKFRNLWRQLKEQLPENILVIDYADMHSNSFYTLEKICDHFNFNVSKPFLELASRNSTFIKMRSVEESNSYNAPWLRPRNGFLKTRKGMQGSYKEELSETDIIYLDELIYKYRHKDIINFD